jgi:hypothetical protein
MCAGCSLLFPETVAAKHGPPLGGTERNGRFLPAVRADSRGFRFARGRYLGGRAFLLAGLAPFRLVRESLLMEKPLFSGREGEIRAAVHALQLSVLEFHGIDPLSTQTHNAAPLASPGSHVAYTACPLTNPEKQNRTLAELT